MCGIAGILTSSKWTDRLQTSLRSMREGLRHRGPDDEGTWVNEAAGVGLAHTRLSILDLSSSGHQPMVSPDQRYVIVFNGEIYNFRDLRQSLEAAGREFHTHSDTEVLLELYAQHGTAMLSQLRGMFAFCIWDTIEQTAFLARDPLGIKPLYYASTDLGFVFASELRPLKRCGLVPDAVDREAVVQYLETGSVPEPLTLLQSVRVLPAGHWLKWTAKRFDLKSYWQPSFGSGLITSNPVELTRAALLDSLSAHFVSDVPVGVFLSGGIDSTALVALARELGHRDLATFSIGVDHAGLDESNVARRSALHFGTAHHELRMTAETGESVFQGFLQSVDQPSIDGFNSYTVSNFAQKQGMKVVLSGLGGDELFGGYPSFQRVPKMARLGQTLHRIPGLASGLGTLMEHYAPQARWRRLGGFLCQNPSLPNAWKTFRGVFSPNEARRIAHRLLEARGEPPSATHQSAEATLSPSSVDPDLSNGDTISALELTLYMRNQLLRDSDVMSMANSLELRVPFVDQRLFEAVAQIPADQRLSQGKALLLQAVPEVPEWVSNQPKRGFTFPFEQWMGQSLGDTFQTVSQQLPHRNATWYQRWAVFMLQRWLAN